MKLPSFFSFIAYYLAAEGKMENEILIGSNSDLTIQKIKKELRGICEALEFRVIDDLEQMETPKNQQLFIVDLSVYTPGIIDRIEQFKSKFPKIELVAVTYTNDELIDQMLVKRGIDQVACREELPGVVERYLSLNLQD